MAAVGLAQNFSACRALCLVIQKGHMSLQYKSLAIVVGAKVKNFKSCEQLKQEPKANTEAAKRILKSIRHLKISHENLEMEEIPSLNFHGLLCYVN